MPYIFQTDGKNINNDILENSYNIIKNKKNEWKL